MRKSDVVGRVRLHEGLRVDLGLEEEVESEKMKSFVEYLLIPWFKVYEVAFKILGIDLNKSDMANNLLTDQMELKTPHWGL